MQYFGFDKPSFGFKAFGFGLNVFNPLTLFTGGKQGVFLDPSDLTTLFQDSAGTVPVTVNGDPVGKVLDKSGNGNHATQTISASRPTYRTDGILHWLAFDGVDDYLNIGNFTTPLAQPFTTTFAVERRPAASSATYKFLFDSKSTNRVYATDYTKGFGFSAGTVSGDIALTPNLRVLSLEFNAVLSKVLSNDGNNLGPYNVGTRSLGDMVIGSRFNGVEVLNMDFYGMLVFSGTDNIERTGKINTYLVQKIGS